MKPQRDERPIKSQPANNPYAPPPRNLNFNNEHLGVEIAIPGQDKIVVKPKAEARAKQVSIFYNISQIDLAVMNPSSFIRITLTCLIKDTMDLMMLHLNNNSNSNGETKEIKTSEDKTKDSIKTISLRTQWFGIPLKSLHFQYKEGNRKELHIQTRKLLLTKIKDLVKDMEDLHELHQSDSLQGTTGDQQVNLSSQLEQEEENETMKSHGLSLTKRKQKHFLNFVIQMAMVLTLT